MSNIVWFVLFFSIYQSWCMRIKMYILPRFYINSCPFSGTYYVGHTRCQFWVDRLQFVNSVLYMSVSPSYNIMTFFYIVCFSIALGTVFFLRVSVLIFFSYSSFWLQMWLNSRFCIAFADLGLGPDLLGSGHWRFVCFSFFSFMYFFLFLRVLD